VKSLILIPPSATDFGNMLLISTFGKYSITLLARMAKGFCDDVNFGIVGVWGSLRGSQKLRAGVVGGSRLLANSQNQQCEEVTKFGALSLDREALSLSRERGA
jgi:hypothetical protein